MVIYLSSNYGDIPEFLNRTALTTGLLDKDKRFILTPDVYNIMISTLNTLVDHLNDGRIIEGMNELIGRFDALRIPARYQLPSGKEQSDYFGPKFVRIWNLHVSPMKDMYVKNDPDKGGR